MISEFKRFISRFYFMNGSTIHYKVKRTIQQSKSTRQNIAKITLCLWLLFAVFIVVKANLENIGKSIMYMFNNKTVIYDLVPVYIMLFILGLMICAYFLCVYLSSRFSPIKNYRLLSLLHHASSELDLLSNHKIYQKEEPIRRIEWVFKYIDDELQIKLFPGGHVSDDQTEKVAKNLTSFLILQTHNVNEWVLTDSFVDEISGSTSIVYGSPRNRFVIDSLDKICSHSENIRLDSSFYFSPRKQVHLIAVGRTGSAKTTLIKSILLQVISDRKNKIYICDGKSSYLSTIKDIVPEIDVTNSGEELLEMLTEINEIISERYHKMKSNIEEERDLTYIDMFPEEGHVYFMFDEILAMFSVMEGKDKLLKPVERLLPKIQALFTSVLQLGRAANVHVILSGQQIPSTILPTSSRESFGCRMILGNVDPSNAIEILGVGRNSLPKVDSSNYGGLIWLDGYGWDSAKFMLLPYIDETKIKFKKTLRYIVDSEAVVLGEDEAQQLLHVT